MATTNNAISLAHSIDRTKFEALSNEEKLALFEAIKQANADMQAALAQQASKGNIRVSEKGAVSVYGLGRFPITLYRSQWESLIGGPDDLGMVPEIKAFIVANVDKLTTEKPPAEERKASNEAKIAQSKALATQQR